MDRASVQKTLAATIPGLEPLKPSTVKRYLSTLMACLRHSPSLAPQQIREFLNGRKPQYSRNACCAILRYLRGRAGAEDRELSSAYEQLLLDYKGECEDETKDTVESASVGPGITEALHFDFDEAIESRMATLRTQNELLTDLKRIR